MSSSKHDHDAPYGGTGIHARTLMLTVYGVVISGAYMLAVTEGRWGHALLVWAACLAHALVVGPGGPPLLARRLCSVLAVTALAVIVVANGPRDFSSGYGAARFLLVLQVVMLFGPRRLRDLRLIQFTTLFVMLVAARYGADLSYLPAFVATCLFLMANAMVIAMLPPPQEPIARSRAPTPPVRLGSLARGVWLPAATVTALSALLFVTLPRFSVAAGLARPMPRDLTIGFSETVSLREVGKLRESANVALQAQFFPADWPQMPMQMTIPLLMRGVSLHHYEAGRWSGRHRAIYAREPAPGGPLGQAFFDTWDVYSQEGSDVRKHHVRQTIRNGPSMANTFFSLYRPVRLIGRWGRIHRVTHQLTGRTGMDPTAQDYTVEAMVPEFTEEQLHAAGTPEPADPWQFFWHVPADIRPLLEQAATEIEDEFAPETDYDRVRATERYLLDPARFRYTLDLPAFGDRDPVEAFLKETRVGSCEQFASALALILRVWDIPTRLVVGFKGGQLDTATMTYLFRDRDAHAWVEVYFRGLGWVQFDPTPGATGPGDGPLPREQSKTLLQRITRLYDRAYDHVQMRWHTNVVQFDAPQQHRILKGLAVSFQELADGLSTPLRAVWPGMPPLGGAGAVVVIVAFVALAMSLHLLGQWLPSRFPMRRAGRGEVPRFYGELTALLRKKGLARPPHATAREFAALACGALSMRACPESAARAVRFITELYYRARFGGYQPTERQQEQLRRALQEVAAAPHVGRSDRHGRRQSRP